MLQGVVFLRVRISYAAMVAHRLTRLGQSENVYQ